MKDESTLTTRDLLAIERTKLSNERTFLAYFRTFIVFLGFGISILKFEILNELKIFGILLTIMSSIILIIGIARLFKTKSVIRKHF